MDDEEDKEGGGQEVQVVSLLLRHVVFFWLYECIYRLFEALICLWRQFFWLVKASIFFF